MGEGGDNGREGKFATKTPHVAADPELATLDGLGRVCSPNADTTCPHHDPLIIPRRYSLACGVVV